MLAHHEGPESRRDGIWEAAQLWPEIDARRRPLAHTLLTHHLLTHRLLSRRLLTQHSGGGGGAPIFPPLDKTDSWSRAGSLGLLRGRLRPDCCRHLDRRSRCRIVFGQ